MNFFVRPSIHNIDGHKKCSLNLTKIKTITKREIVEVTTYIDGPNKTIKYYCLDFQLFTQTVRWRFKNKNTRNKILTLMLILLDTVTCKKELFQLADDELNQEFFSHPHGTTSRTAVKPKKNHQS